MIDWTPEKIVKICEERGVFKGTNWWSVRPGEYLRVWCPFHRSEQPTAGFKTSGVFNCLELNCPKDLTFFALIDLLRNFPNYNIPETLEELISSKDKEQVIASMNKLLYDEHLEQTRQFIYSYKITKEVLEEVGVGFVPNGSLFTVPIWFGPELIGRKFYNPNPDINNGQTKSWSTKGLKTGYVVPFDPWRKSDKPTLLVAGEKDMLVARSQGYNAITIIGGEKQLPNTVTSPYFQGREVIIAYDNDEPGRIGAKQLGTYLKSLNCKVTILGSVYHELLPNKGDITDWFQKYDKDKLDEIIDISKMLGGN